MPGCEGCPNGSLGAALAEVGFRCPGVRKIVFVSTGSVRPIEGTGGLRAEGEVVRSARVCGFAALRKFAERVTSLGEDTDPGQFGISPESDDHLVDLGALRLAVDDYKKGLVGAQADMVGIVDPNDSSDGLGLRLTVGLSERLNAVIEEHRE